MSIATARLASSTVKVRRLGYFMAMCSLLRDHHLPKRLFLVALARWAREHHRDLKSYSDTLPVSRTVKSIIPGEIGAKQGEIVSARRYVETAIEMGLITQIHNVLQNTKYGHLLVSVPAGRNSFGISVPQRFLLLRILLRTDYLYLKSLLDLIERKTSDSSDEFRRRVLELVDKSMSRPLNPMEFQRIRDLRRNLNHWDSPSSYFRDHVRAPRLEWLIDLGLLTKWNQRVNYLALRPHARDFFSRENIGEGWLNSTFMRIFHDCFQKELGEKVLWSSLNGRKQDELIDAYLKRAFKLFASKSEIKIVSASQFLEYSLCALMTQKGIVASRDEVERSLVEITSGSSSYRYERMTSEIDVGYIVKRAF